MDCGIGPGSAGRSGAGGQADARHSATVSANFSEIDPQPESPAAAMTGATIATGAHGRAPRCALTPQCETAPFHLSQPLVARQPALQGWGIKREIGVNSIY